jgi:hypothetical protein
VQGPVIGPYTNDTDIERSEKRRKLPERISFFRVLLEKVRLGFSVLVFVLVGVLLSDINVFNLNIHRI